MDVSFNLVSPITLNEPVAIDVVIKDQGPYAVTLDLGFRGTEAFHFKVVTPDGKIMSPEFQGGISPYGTLRLEPMDEYYQRIVLNEWFRFDVPGDYRILVTTELPIIIGKTDLPVIKRKDASDHQTEEALLALAILPRNEVALRQRCDALFHKFQKSPEFSSERLNVARELSCIKDPIAIP